MIALDDKNIEETDDSEESEPEGEVKKIKLD